MSVNTHRCYTLNYENHNYDMYSTHTHTPAQHTSARIHTLSYTHTHTSTQTHTHTHTSDTCNYTNVQNAQYRQGKGTKITTAQ